ncbi:MAG: 30S ribosomal protein S24e [Thermoplasmata archaeon]|nr:30S ribosomal protein S24e [Thermoplasmata archaeon]
MEVEIVETRPNPLLKRTEYRFSVSHAEAATPQRDALRSEVAKLVKVPKERVVIERVRARFGIARSEGVAAAYETTEALKAVVRSHILVRNGLKEKPVKGPAAPAAEAPAAAAAPAAAPPAESKA